MAKGKSTFDVFISHGPRDAAISANIARVLRSYDLKVFTDAEVGAGQTMEDVVWEAISESQAFVTVIPETDPVASRPRLSVVPRKAEQTDLRCRL